MTHRIQSVKPLEDVVILATFRNGVEKTYDVKQLYSTFPQFKVLEENRELFDRVRVDAGGYGIVWNDELDLDAEEIWEQGLETGRVQAVDVKMQLAENLIAARGRQGITQKQLALNTGIDQGDISKIENGAANPSVSTLQRLARGMGMALRVEFVSFGDDT